MKCPEEDNKETYKKKQKKKQKTSTHSIILDRDESLWGWWGTKVYMLLSCA